ncbi:MAG TPA: hypothetical protein VG186_14565 [Solirubrobacteraceae bacterium]|nr:hypothetical protein [Solirubrobacteraceae bacterium]
MTRDSVVAPRKQRSLATTLGAQVIEAPLDHLEVVNPRFRAPLLEALAAVGAGDSASVRRASVR